MHNEIPTSAGRPLGLLQWKTPQHRIRQRLRQIHGSVHKVVVSVAPNPEVTCLHWKNLED